MWKQCSESLTLHTLNKIKYHEILLITSCRIFRSYAKNDAISNLSTRFRSPFMGIAHRHSPKKTFTILRKGIEYRPRFDPDAQYATKSDVTNRHDNAYAIANRPPTVDFIVNCSLCAILVHRILALLAGAVPCVCVRCLYWCGCVLNDNYLWICSTRWRRCRRYANRVSVSLCECVCKLKYTIHHRIYMCFCYLTTSYAETAKREMRNEKNNEIWLSSKPIHDFYYYYFASANVVRFNSDMYSFASTYR